MRLPAIVFPLSLRRLLSCSVSPLPRPLPVFPVLCLREHSQDVERPAPRRRAEHQDRSLSSSRRRTSEDLHHCTSTKGGRVRKLLPSVDEKVRHILHYGKAHVTDSQGSRNSELLQNTALHSLGASSCEGSSKTQCALSDAAACTTARSPHNHLEKTQTRSECRLTAGLRRPMSPAVRCTVCAPAACPREEGRVGCLCPAGLPWLGPPKNNAHLTFPCPSIWRVVGKLLSVPTRVSRLESQTQARSFILIAISGDAH